MPKVRLRMVGVLLLSEITQRQNGKRPFDNMLYTGLKIVLDELEEEYEVCGGKDINKYGYVLVSLTSVMDVENLMYTLSSYAKGKAIIVVGGAGCINIRSYKDLIDIAVFGRAEGQINGIINGIEYDNVWRQSTDPDVEGEYIIRQATKLTEQESSIGCPRKCAFCQYTWTRKSMGGRYHHGGDISSEEDDFEKIRFTKPGHYTTAFDGLSEATRKRVNKHWCKEEDIKKKFKEIYTNNRIDKAVCIKLFQIIGYPWETKQTLFEDIRENTKTWGRVGRGNKQNKRIVVMYLFTPFSPEPLTPMQYEKANIVDNWREYLGGGSCYKIYDDNNINVFTLPQINSGFTLAKRVMVNRATNGNAEIIRKIILNKKLKALKAATAVSSILPHIGNDIFNEIGDEYSGFGYLSTYIKIPEFKGARQCQKEQA